MKKIFIVFAIVVISCAAGYAWGQDYNMTMQPGTTFFQLNQPSPGPTMRRMNDDNATNPLNNPQQSPQDYRENRMNQINDDKTLRQNQHQLNYQKIQDNMNGPTSSEQQIQNNIDQHINQDQLKLDQSHTNK